MTVVFVVLVMSGIMLLSLSNRLDVWIAENWGAFWATGWRLGSLASGYGVLLFVVEFIYHVAPNVRRPWRWITPGSVLAVFLWLAGTRLFGANEINVRYLRTKKRKLGHILNVDE